MRGCVLAASATSALALGAPVQDPILEAMDQELARATKSLSARADAPIYYLSYRVADGDAFSESASFGSLEKELQGTTDPLAGHHRALDVSLRVGSRVFDNTHKSRGGFDYESRWGPDVLLPIEPDVGAMRLVLWRATDHAYKRALKRLISAKANRAVKIEEDEEKVDDFSEERPHTSIGRAESFVPDRLAWRERLKRLSSLFKGHPSILHSGVSLQLSSATHYFADSQGSRIREPRFYARVVFQAAGKADDGSDLELYDSVESSRPEELPTEAQLEAKIRTLISNLEALRHAKVVEPYSGPAIISARAAAVFFHEIFGHRVEGHRQKDADDGHTFTKKVGQKVVPEFISVVDDPTLKRFNELPLNGYYQFDDEGVPAQRVPLVKSGVLQGFLMGRSPIQGFPHSNGHGRAQPGLAPVARQGNLVVSSSHELTPGELRRRLLEEVKRKGKPYGLYFDDISGGFTNTTANGSPQAFKVLPLIVYRIYPDGRPDELVRGVDLVGTPLASFERILATGSDYRVFNGYCGAESGFVPVSAVAPSLLVGEIEVERRGKSHDRPPLLAAPPLSPPEQAAAPVVQGDAP